MKTAAYWNNVLTDWLNQELPATELLKQVQLDVIEAAASECEARSDRGIGLEDDAVAEASACAEAIRKLLASAP